MAVIVPENWPKLLEPGLRKVFETSKDGLTDYIPMFFGEHDTDRITEHDYKVGSLGRLQKLADVGSVPYTTFKPGYEKQYTQEEYVGGVEISRLMYSTEQYNVMNKMVAKEALMTHTSLQEYAAGVFNNAFATVLGPDGKVLCAADHPTNSVDSTAKVNFYAYDLTPDNLATVRKNMRMFKDDGNHFVGAKANMLIVPPALEETAYVITSSAQKAGTADNDTNFHKGKWDVVVCDYLTDDNAWFVVDSNLMKLNLNWFWLQRPEFKSENDFDTLVAKYRVYSAFAYGFSDWQWVIGCNPS